MAGGGQYQWRPPKVRLFMTDSVAVICESDWFTGTYKHVLGFLWRDETCKIVWLQENGCRRGNLVGLSHYVRKLGLDGSSMFRGDNHLRYGTVCDADRLVMEGDGIVVSSAGADFVCYSLG